MLDIKKLLVMLASLYNGNVQGNWPHPCRGNMDEDIDTYGFYQRFEDKYRLDDVRASL
jgi:hypothetical protein